MMLGTKDVDCFVASETWFRDQHSYPMTSIDNFCCFRDDRKDRIGGGVAIWTKAFLSPEEIIMSEKPVGVEVVAVKLKSKMLLIGAYVPPQTVASHHNDVIQFFIHFIDTFLDQYPLYDVLLCGDLNRLKVDSICNSCNLVNIHNHATYGEAELDYILISESVVSSYSVHRTTPIDESSVPHLALLAIPTSTMKNNIHVSRVVYDLRSSNVQSFIDCLSNTDWSFLSNDVYCLNEKCTMFQEYLKFVFHNTIPTTNVTFTSNTKPWITPLIKHLINERWRAYRERRFQIFNHLKIKIRREIVKSKLSWANKMKGKDMWKVVNEIRCQRTSDPMKSLYSKFNTIETAANAINQKLSEVFSEKIPTCLPRPASPATNPIIVEQQVFNLLQKLPIRKASPDIPLKLYKAAAHILAPPLTALFRYSIENSSVPDAWKISAVSLQPKTRNPVSADDIRPISLLPPPVKILESLILDFARPYFLQGYGNFQYGFRPRSSTTCALISLHDHITRSLDDTHVAGVQVISYDLSKAFDRLRHDVIIKRLLSCNVPYTLVCWLSSYLENRKQYVKVGTVNSHLTNVRSGVPQGSILGPYLFCLVMGSLEVPENDCCVIKFADDITISVPIYKNSINSHVTNIHDSITTWSKTFGLPLNKRKSKCLPIPRSRNFKSVSLPDVDFVDSLTILGVTFNTKCTWSHHVDKVLCNASRRLFPLRLLKPYVDNDQLKMAYFGLMRSVLEYAAPLFVGITKTDAEKFEKLQNRFHRLLCGKHCEKECLQSLGDRRKRQAVTLYGKLLNSNHILHSFSCQISSHGRLILPHIRSTRSLNAFVMKAAILYNNFMNR